MNTALAVLGATMAAAGLWLFIYLTDLSSRRTTEHAWRVFVAALLMIGGTMLAVMASADRFAVNPAYGS